jgi:hypothetical protein
LYDCVVGLKVFPGDNAPALLPHLFWRDGPNNQLVNKFVQLSTTPLSASNIDKQLKRQFPPSSNNSGAIVTVESKV